MDKDITEEKKGTGKVVLFWLFGFFVTFATVDAFFVYIAVQTHAGVVTEQSYEKGLKYNTALEQAKMQAEMDIKVKTSLDNNVLSVTLTDKSNAPLIGATVTAQLKRPVHQGYDFDLLLHHKGNGVYKKDVTMPLAGVWTAEIGIQWQHNAKAQIYQTARTFTVPK